MAGKGLRASLLLFAVGARHRILKEGDHRFKVIVVVVAVVAGIPRISPSAPAVPALDPLLGFIPHLDVLAHA